MNKNRGLGPAGMARIEAALLKYTDGADSRQIAKATGYATTSASKGLGDLSQVGKAMHIRGAYGKCTWFHVTQHKAMRDHIAAETAKRAGCTANAARAAGREARFVTFEDDPVHRIVPAHLAKPLRPTGPSSVWGLA